MVTTSLPYTKVVQSYIFKSVLTKTHILIANEAKKRTEARTTDIGKSCPGCGSNEIDVRGKCFNCKRPRRMLGHKEELAYYEDPFYVDATQIFNNMLNFPGRGLRVIYKPGFDIRDPLFGYGTVYMGFLDDVISRWELEADYLFEYDVNPRLIEKMANDLFEYIKKEAPQCASY